MKRYVLDISRVRVLVLVVMLLSCFVIVPEGRATTAGYSDSGQCYLGWGVVGARYTGTGTNDEALYGYATQYTNNSTYGVWGESNSYYGAGVRGRSNPTAGTSAGVEGLANSTEGDGVRGIAYADTGPAYGVNGQSYSNSGTGVFGYASSTGGVTYGVYGYNKSTSGRGVYGYAGATSGPAYGVYGYSNSTSGRGVYGYAGANAGTTFGVFGYSKSNSGRGVLGWAPAASGNTFGVYGQSNSNSGKGVFGYAYATSGTNIGVYGYTRSPFGYGVYSNGNMHVLGNFTAIGTKSAVVKLDNGEGITLYAEEASENWFSDCGSSRLEKGKAVVEIDPTFAQTVNTAAEYLVFLTPEGDCRGLYVAQKGETSFEVRELGEGHSNITFNYRIMVKRKGYETERLARVDKKTMTSMLTPVKETAIAQNNEGTKVALAISKKD